MSDELKFDLNIVWQLEPVPELPEARLLQAVEWVLREHKVAPGTGVSLVITSDEAIRRLNQQFRGVDAPTGVLSFPASPISFPGEPPYLGDLILALPYIQRQAAAERHGVADELMLAAIHGTLHLLGYDHDTAEHQSVMWAAQAKALRAMGIDIQVPFFEFPDDRANEGSGSLGE